MQAFGLERFHRAISAEHHLPCFGRKSALALVVGNTRALWPCFAEALRSRPERLDASHPLDDYVVETLTEALATVELRHQVHHGHHRAEKHIALQRIAHAAGLAELGPAHLCVHPEHGPWIALRAVIVFDIEASELGIDDSAPEFPASHCQGCAAPCVSALDRALAAQNDPGKLAWLAIRDACPVGRTSRYDADQIRYHYAKDRAVLRRLLDA